MATSLLMIEQDFIKVFIHSLKFAKDDMDILKIENATTNYVYIMVSYTDSFILFIAGQTYEKLKSLVSGKF